LQEPIKEQVKSVEVSSIMRESYIDYAMSVIVARALPDVRDGLKPAQRRILYTMLEEGLRHNAKFRKSATVVGSTLGRYHPHGDVAVYDTLVRLAQDFTLRYPLVQGQGNFGSIDGDPPAAQRYTECRLSRIGEETLRDIEKIRLILLTITTARAKSRRFCRLRCPNYCLTAHWVLQWAWRLIFRPII